MNMSRRYTLLQVPILHDYQVLSLTILVEQTSPAQFDISSPQPSPSPSMTTQVVDFAFDAQNEGHFGTCGVEWQGVYGMVELETCGMMGQYLNPMLYHTFGFGEGGSTGIMYGSYTDFVLYP